MPQYMVLQISKAHVGNQKNFQASEKTHST